jgi:hypothetical protein
VIFGTVSVPTQASDVDAIVWIPTSCVLIAIDGFVVRGRLAGLDGDCRGESVRSMKSFFRLTGGALGAAFGGTGGSGFASLSLRRGDMLSGGKGEASEMGTWSGGDEWQGR